MNGRDTPLSGAHPQLVAALSGAPVAALVVDGSGTILYANAPLLSLFGYVAEALLFQPLEMLLPEDARAAHARRRLETPAHYRAHTMGHGLQITGRHRDGSEIALDIRLQTNESDCGRVTVAFVSDRRPALATRLELSELNRTLRLLHECNVILVRARSEHELLSGIAHSMAGVGRYLQVWVGLLPCQGERFRVSLCAGQPHQGMSEAGVTGVERLARRALNNGVPLLLSADELQALAPLLCPVLPGVALPALIALPLLIGSAVLGCLCVASNGGNAFLSREVELLQELADDLAFGLHALQAQARHQSTNARLALLERAVEASGNAILITDAQHKAHPILYANPAFERMTGYPASDTLGRSTHFLLGADLAQDALVALRAALQGGYEARSLLRNYRQDGHLFWNELTVAPVRNEAGVVTHFVSVMNDVTIRQQQQAQIERHARYDALTGLPNRTTLFERIAQSVAAIQRDGQGLSVVLMGLDRFAWINDAYGHEAGDALLRAVAERLLDTLHARDTVARLGGDEFVVLLFGLAPAAVMTVVERLSAALARPFALACGQVVVSASIGVSFAPRDGNNAQALIRNAEVAMQGAKTGGLNAVRCYAEDMNQRTAERLAMEFDLRRALERDEFELHYQPIIDLESGHIVEAEALLRWNRPQHGRVAPDQFIPLAEASGLIVPIGQWVLHQACRQSALWRAAGLPPIGIGVNLSARQFQEAGLEAQVAHALATHGLVGSDLVLEVTESLLMTHLEAASATLRHLKQLGVHVSLDDFGTGYSSLSYLKRLPLDTLKIDRSFVRDIGTDPHDAAIATTIISMARTMQLDVIAEGVETRAQLAHLSRHGCQRVQGYLFSPPVSAERFQTMLGDRCFGELLGEPACIALATVNLNPPLGPGVRHRAPNGSTRPEA